MILDTGVFLQTIGRVTGPAAAVLRLFEAGAFVLITSSEILNEVREVLTRPLIRRKFPAITDERLDSLFARLKMKADVVEDVPHRFRFPRDAKDEPFLNLAIHSDATHMVSWDRDLLNIMGSTDESAQIFRQLGPRLSLLTPVALLRELLSTSRAEATTNPPFS